MVDELEKIYKSKILAASELVATLSSSRPNNKVIMCHGVFDVVHLVTLDILPMPSPRRICL